MAKLVTMPPLEISQPKMAQIGQAWTANNGRLSRTPPDSSGDLGKVFDTAVGAALAVMLGDRPIVTPNANSLTPSEPDCVEVGPVRIIGGVRPQNFDVGYRPDGVRFAYDTKTPNDSDSVKKNWQNMINDLSTEAVTVHSRFPHAVVAFLVAVPEPCLNEPQRSAMVETLERLARRLKVADADYMAEAISLVVWNPEDGSISREVPAPASPLRIEKFSLQVETAYVSRYKGLPPHAA